MIAEQDAKILDGRRMGILNELVEKKDLSVYIQERIKQLERTRRDTVKSKDLKHRQTTINKMNARIVELKKLQAVLSNNEVRKMSIKYWRDNVRR